MTINLNIVVADPSVIIRSGLMHVETDSGVAFSYR
jgi:hypothetical protein